MAKHLRRGDIVQVISGKHRGQQGKVVSVLVARERVRIEGIAVVKRHLKPGKEKNTPDGGIVERLGSIHISNVLPLDPESGKPTRVGFKVEVGPDGKKTKVRIARRSGKPLAPPAA